MKILWIVNLLLPELCKELLLPINPYGGWLVGLSNQLKQQNFELHIVTVDKTFSGFSKNINGINYHIVDNCINSWLQIEKKIVQPDVVHIHGTEFNYGIQYIKANGSDNVVFSIQGLISVCEKFYFAGIPKLEILQNITFRDFVKRDNLFQAKRKFKERGKLEKEYFRLCKHVIGRTEWDKAHSYFKNRYIRYHFCNEMLRDKFYESKKWEFERCDQFTIFLSQANYPLKGLHKVLEAVVLLKDEFPEIKIKIAGNNIIKTETLTEKLKLTGYGNIIRKKIIKLGLFDNVEFLGNLQEDEIITEYLRANIFVCPSAIENSSNSLAEAQILGVPSIVSYVGGVSNMVVDEFNGLIYRYEEVEMLAFKIKKLFLDLNMCYQLSTNSILTAEKRHERKDIMENLISIYNIVALC